ncbi:MAG: pilus assembly protein PilM [Polyangiaceae bacterium]
MARWLGVDVGDASVRVALLRSTFRNISVEALREEPIAEHGSASGALRAAVLGLKADSYGSAVSGARAFLRVLRLPKAAQKELANILSFEVEATLPFELDDAVMDHRILTRLRGDEDSIPILAGVAYTPDVRDQINLVRRGTGHEPSRVGIGPLPLANLVQVCPSLSQKDPVAIIDLDQEHTDLLILQRGEARFARCIQRGVMSLPHEATQLARELRQSIGAWRAHGGDPPSAIHIVGGGSVTPGIETFIARELGIAPQSLPKLQVIGADQQTSANLPRFARSIAIALGQSRRANDLNLRQGPLEAQQGYHFLREKTPLLAGLAAAVTVSFGFSIFAESRALDQERTHLEARLRASSKMHLGTSTSDPEEAAELLEQAISGKSQDPMPQMDGFDALVALSGLISHDITHDINEYYYDRGKVMLTGMVPTIDNAQAVRDAISGHRCFQDVTMKGTKRLGSKQKQKYDLSFVVKCAPANSKKTSGSKGAAKNSGAAKAGGSAPKTGGKK